MSTVMRMLAMKVGSFFNLVLVGGEIGINIWLPGFEAYSEQGGIAKK